MRRTLSTLFAALMASAATPAAAAPVAYTVSDGGSILGAVDVEAGEVVGFEPWTPIADISVDPDAPRLWMALPAR